MIWLLITRKTVTAEDDGQMEGGPTRVFLFVGEDGEVVEDQERGERLMGELKL